MTNEQSVLELEKEATKLKDNYLLFLTKIVTNKNNNMEPSMEDILQCQQLGNKYFNHIESFVGNSGLLGAHKNDKWIVGFAETCKSVLNTHIEHIKFLRSYKSLLNNINIEPSKQSYANMKRIVQEYLPKSDLLEIKSDFRKNSLPIYGFESDNFSIKIKKIWKGMSMIEKIGTIGSFASIIGLMLYFIPSSSASNNINIKNNKQSPIVENNYGNITYNIDNSNSNKVEIMNKINVKLTQVTTNIKGNSRNEQKNINAKIFILGESKKINEKNITLKQKNIECKNKVDLSVNLFKYDRVLLYKSCDDIF